MRSDRFGADNAGVGEHLRVGVIPGEAAKDALSVQIRSRVADVYDEQIVTQTVRARHRRTHSAKLGL